jgi:cytoskeleton protein RodZ
MYIVGNDKPAVDLMDKVHVILIKAREKKGLNVDEISEYVRIRPQYIRALESGHTNNMLSDVYTVGYLKIYAEYLGLDSRVLIEQFKLENGNLKMSDSYVPRSEREHIAPNKMLLIFSIALAILIYFIWSRASNSTAKLNQDFSIIQNRLKEHHDKKIH